MTDEVRVIDLEAEFWNSLNQAAAESNWIPQEHYFMNDWVSDCCDFLRNGPRLPEPFATIPDPQAFMEAARGMREALERHLKWLNGLPIPTQGCTAQMMELNERLRAFDAAAQGEQ